MLAALERMVRHRAREGAAFDPSSIGDPIARQTEWSAVAPGGASFCTHRLVRVSPHRVEFSATLGAKAFYSIFLLAGAGVLLFELNAIRVGEPGFSSDAPWIPLLAGAVFFAVGAVMLWIGSSPRVFDQARGAFWRGRGAPMAMGAPGRSERSAPLSSIHALQLVAEYVSGQKSSFHSYELNLVLVDGRRINVVDHGNLERLRDDAASLGRFLGRPVWDAT